MGITFCFNAVYLVQTITNFGKDPRCHKVSLGHNELRTQVALFRCAILGSQCYNEVVNCGYAASLSSVGSQG